MEENNIFNVAVYLRISRDDEECGSVKAESNSISSQREIIRSFIGNHSNMQIYDIYVDDGWSGINFDRPEFKRMMNDIQLRNVNCVIVKDLSRLGRDYIEAGRLIQKTFPAFSVRFIAITDNFDSLTADFNEKSLVLPIKNFINDSYCRDISVKVKSHQKIKRENGEFIGAFCIYGYKKSEVNKNVLVPDAYAAEVVRKIFLWKMQGYSNKAIAERLEQFGILSPMEYKKSNGENFHTGFVTNIKTRWSAVAVKRILINENYTGNLVQGKEEKINYKINKSVRKPSEEWIRVENTHEAIVSKEDFYLVQELMKTNTRAADSNKKAHKYSGLLFCGNCKNAMMRRKNNYHGKENICFICSDSNKGRVCSRHSIMEKELDSIVLSVLRQQLAIFMDKYNVVEHTGRMDIDYGKLAVYDSEIERLRDKQDKYINLRLGLYEDLKSNIITQSDFNDFRNIYERRYKEYQKAISSQEQMRQKLFKAGVESGVNLELIKKVPHLAELDRMTLLTFVKRIYIYEDKRIYIKLRFRHLFFTEIMSGNND